MISFDSSLYTFDDSLYIWTTTGDFSVVSFLPTNGYVGDPITIYGTGFYSEPIIKIGEVTCTIDSFSDTQIDFHIPSGAQTNYISVSAGSDFETTEVPLTVTRSSITLHDDLICENLIITEWLNSQSHKINSRGILFKPLSVNSIVDISNSDISCYIFQIDDADDKLQGNLLANIIIEEQT